LPLRSGVHPMRLQRVMALSDVPRGGLARDGNSEGGAKQLGVGGQGATAGDVPAASRGKGERKAVPKAGRKTASSEGPGAEGTADAVTAVSSSRTAGGRRKVLSTKSDAAAPVGPGSDAARDEDPGVKGTTNAVPEAPSGRTAGGRRKGAPRPPSQQAEKKPKKPAEPKRYEPLSRELLIREVGKLGCEPRCSCFFPQKNEKKHRNFGLPSCRNAGRTRRSGWTGILKCIGRPTSRSKTLVQLMSSSAHFSPAVRRGKRGRGGRAYGWVN
jgi:hypothetical protein